MKALAPAGTRAEPGLVLRPTQGDDVDALQRFVAALSLRTRVDRFFAPVRELPRELVRAIERGDPRHRLLVAERRGEIVALGQHAADAEPWRCDVAIVVADRWQGSGIGTAVLARVLEDAARRGLREARLETLATNRAMHRLARRAGFALQPHPADAGLVCGRRALGAA